MRRPAITILALVLGASGFSFVSSLSLAGTTSSASAQNAAASGAQQFLQTRHEEVNRILRRAARTVEERERRTRDLNARLTDLLDYEELSRQALSTHWQSKTAAERATFVDLLRRLVERGYERNLEGTLEFEIRYLGETAGADGAVIVRTSARSRTRARSTPVAIDYTLRRNGNAWRVFDITTDGVSMVRNYRNQFQRIITRDGWNALIDRMRRRLESNSDAL